MRKLYVALLILNGCASFQTQTKEKFDWRICYRDQEPHPCLGVAEAKRLKAYLMRLEEIAEDHE